MNELLKNSRKELVMAIIYNQETGEFHLYNDGISYIMKILRNGQMGQLYFGKKVPAEQSYSYLEEHTKRSTLTEVYENQYGFSLEQIRQEYPSYGTTD